MDDGAQHLANLGANRGANLGGSSAEAQQPSPGPWTRRTGAARSSSGSSPQSARADERSEARIEEGGGDTRRTSDAGRTTREDPVRLGLPESWLLRHDGGAARVDDRRERRSAVAPSMSEPLSEPDGREATAAQVRLSGAFAGASDHDLVRAIQAADQDAFAELVARHEGRAYRVARQLVPDADEARDVAQEAFLRIFRNSERFDFEHEFTTWLYRIVTNLCIDHLRRRRPRTVGGDEDEPGPEVVDEGAIAPSQRLEQNETAALVRACVARLPEHFRVVIALRELEGLTCQEISRIVGATPVTVRWRLHRARKLFAEQWERLHERGARDYLSSPTAAELARLPRNGDVDSDRPGAS
jgi:RNA polymerase sigma-70 factor (ECF subfamily)